MSSSKPKPAAQKTNNAQQRWSLKMIDSYIKNNPLAFDPDKNSDNWNYEVGCMLKAAEQLYYDTKINSYLSYIKKNIDFSIQTSGTIKNISIEEYNIDSINTGKVLLFLYKKTKAPKYLKAAKFLITQMKGHPRTSEGGFWHKKVYPYQMWLDGLYMASPFLAEYAALTRNNLMFDDVAQQLILVEKKTRNPKTGLLYHAWDETKELAWADKTTGCSPNYWGRAIGWYVMAIVDCLDYLPIDHPKRGEIIGLFERLVPAIGAVQDSKSGVWYQVLDMPDKAGNYLESSCSAMFVYAIAKGVRKGYLSKRFLSIAIKGFKGIIENFVETDSTGNVNLLKVCGGAGLGKHPDRGDYRDGSFEYYIGEEIRTNDRKGVGPFILAALEIEMIK
jgi:unsaturated rhamnogalacturonyl hydrolase